MDTVLLRWPWLIAVATVVVAVTLCLTPVWWLMGARHVDFWTAMQGATTAPAPRIRTLTLPDGRTCYQVENRWRDDLVCDGVVQ